MCSAPGSRSCTRMSTSPGARHSPSALHRSRHRSPGAERSPPTAAIRSPSTSRSPHRVEPAFRVEQPGAAEQQPVHRHRRPVAEIAGQDLEAGHADRDPHLDLLADQAAVDVVGDLAADLDAAVHRPRMHDQRVGLGGAQFVVIEPEEMEIFAGRRHEGAVHALALQPQHHHDVDVGEPLGHVVKDLDAEPLDLGRQQGARRDDPHARPHRVQQRDVRARDAAVQDVAADRDGEPAEPALAPADRQARRAAPGSGARGCRRRH